MLAQQRLDEITDRMCSEVRGYIADTQAFGRVALAIHRNACISQPRLVLRPPPPMFLEELLGRHELGVVQYEQSIGLQACLLGRSRQGAIERSYAFADAAEQTILVRKVCIETLDVGIDRRHSFIATKSRQRIAHSGSDLREQ